MAILMPERDSVTAQTSKLLDKLRSAHLQLGHTAPCERGVGRGSVTLID